MATAAPALFGSVRIVLAPAIEAQTEIETTTWKQFIIM